MARQDTHQQEHPWGAVAAGLAGLVGVSWGAELCTGGRAWGTLQPLLTLGTHAGCWSWGRGNGQPHLGTPSIPLCSPVCQKHQLWASLSCCG